MANILGIIKLIAGILPAIIELIKALETALPQSGIGTDKLAVIKTVVEGAYKASNDSLPALESVWSVVQGIVNSTVSIFNKVGIFTK